MQQENGLASRTVAERERPARALVANEQEIWIWSLETILTPDGFSVIRATTGAQVLEQVQVHDPDVVILHATLRDTSGIELCRQLREQQLVSPTTPILITTSGPCRRSDRLQVLHAGGWDYASLPLDAEEFIARLRVYLAARRSVSRSCSDGLMDPTTGLYDLRGILTRIREMGLAARRYARALGCATVSCAREPISVDRVTSALAREPLPARPEGRRPPDVLRSVVRGCDVIGQLAPNEYVILAPETELPGMLQLANRVIEAFEAESSGTDSPLPVRIGCFAVSDFSAAPMEPLEMLVRSTQALRMAQLPGSPPVQPFSNDSPA